MPSGGREIQSVRPNIYQGGSAGASERWDEQLRFALWESPPALPLHLQNGDAARHPTPRTSTIRECKRYAKNVKRA